jgi:glycosyltransferase involved in cell wall biosynthesis
LIQRLGYIPRKVSTIYNGVDITMWPVSKSQRQQKRLELRLEAQNLLIGTVGRLDTQKDHGVLLQALSKLKSRLPWHCVIIGSGPSLENLQAQLRCLSLEKQVWLIGEREDIPAWLSSFDLFVLPSLWEGLPNSLLEAMAMGLPAIASAVDGIPEIIEDGQNGLLVPSGDPLALSEKIEALAADPERRQRLGKAARETIAQRFTLINMLSGYEAAYEGLMENPRP